jgi:integrase/recombinase XerC
LGKPDDREFRGAVEGFVRAPDNARPLRRSVRGDAVTEVADVDPFPEWFTMFLNDRQTRKPSTHTMKAYRQDFIAIATLVTDGDASGLAVAVITIDAMRTKSFVAQSNSHQLTGNGAC